MPTPWELLSGELARDGTRPLLTWYDDASGERTELSVATTANWVAKLANLLVDDYDVSPGDTVLVRLPLHWQTVVVMLATWATGATVGFDGPGLVAVGSPGSGSDLELTLAPMGADLSRLVASQPDEFVALEPSGTDVVAAAPADLPAGARVLTVLPLDDATGLGYGLLAPLAGAGSVVLVGNPDRAQLPQRCASERVTHTVGLAVSELPQLT